jgi:DNA-binding MarR family transcriptional regulator
MKVLSARTIAPETEPAVRVSERQLLQLIAHFDALAQRLMVRRPPDPAPDIECSAQEMRALAVLGHKGAVIMSDLASILDVPLSTATHTVDKLVGKDLVERTRPAENRRIVQVELSKKGSEIHRSFMDCRLAMGRTMLEALSSGEREIFLELMAKMTRPPTS